jgi:hypothetical protein
MQQRTAADLEELKRIEWFTSVGHAEGDDIVIAKSWLDALEWSEGTWEKVQQEAANRLTESLAAASRDEFQSWNDVVRSVRPIVSELVLAKTRPVVEREGLDSDFVDAVRWDILHLAMEDEYSRFPVPGFFAKLGTWYKKGHWPCGWDGSIDSGRLVVF